MALTPPDITTYTGVTTLQGIINTMITHFGGVSTKFSLIDSNASANVLFEPVAVGESWDARMDSGGDVLIDPLGGRTDAALTTGSAQLSPNLVALLVTYHGTNGKLTFIEFDDAMFVMLSNSDDSGYSAGMHLGRIFDPIYDTDVANGNTGLGALGRKPYIQTSGNGDGWFNDTASSLTQYAPIMYFQEGLTTASWRGRTTALNCAGSKRIRNPTKAQCTMGGSIQPNPIFVGRWFTTRPVYVMKYVWTWWEKNTPKTRITDGTGVKFMHIWNANELESLIIPWNDTDLP